MGITQFFFRRFGTPTQIPTRQSDNSPRVGRHRRAVVSPHTAGADAGDALLTGPHGGLAAKAERTVHTALAPPTPGEHEVSGPAHQRLLNTLVDHRMSFDDRMVTLCEGLTPAAIREQTGANCALLERGIAALGQAQTKAQHADLLFLLSGIVLHRTQAALVTAGSRKVGEQVITRALGQLMASGDSAAIAVLAHPMAEAALLARGAQSLTALVHQTATAPQDLLGQAKEVFEQALRGIFAGEALPARHRPAAGGKDFFAIARATEGMQDFIAQGQTDLALMGLADRAGMSGSLVSHFARDSRVFDQIRTQRGELATIDSADARRLVAIVDIRHAQDASSAERGGAGAPSPLVYARQQLNQLLAD